ncbi:TraB/GumN family protein [Comamonas sp. GB3 AK4-5]|uniref:TraB/GumN family protein n=1 Tax=Comamonas sp. GB3 AK4-5 TaxID=3231487 RepID=UPI00351DB7E3
MQNRRPGSLHMRGLLSIGKRLLAASLLCCGLAQAQTPASTCLPEPQPPTEAELVQLHQQARDRGLLWRLEHEGRTSWLYGTIHVNQRAWFLPGPGIAQALQGTDLLALELDLMDPAVQQELARGMRAPANAQPLPAALRQRLDRLLQAACAPAPVATLRPEAQIITLLALVGRSQGLEPQLGVDLALASIALGLGKSIIGLESPDTQLRELVSDDPAEVQQRVATGLEHLERGDAAQQLMRLAQAWADGDVQALENYPQWCDCLNTEAERAEYARVVDGRNPGMAAGIAQQLRQGHSLFVAVGALHLVGPQGLPALLAAQGFKVQPVVLGAVPAAAGTDKTTTP